MRSVDPTEQLVTEIVVRDIKRSTHFYRAPGFDLLRDGGDFVELTWEDHRLFLAEPAAFRDVEHPDLPPPPPFPAANVRVMVRDVAKSAPDSHREKAIHARPLRVRIRRWHS